MTTTDTDLSTDVTIGRIITNNDPREALALMSKMPNLRVIQQDLFLADGDYAGTSVLISGIIFDGDQRPLDEDDDFGLPVDRYGDRAVNTWKEAN